MAYQWERSLLINMPADSAWEWMSDTRRLLGLNIFHRPVDYPETVTEKGIVVPVEHSFFGLFRQKRIARVHTYRRYFVAWGEFAAKGFDLFPHSQSFTVRPVDDYSCIIINRLCGRFALPGTKYWLMPFYRKIIPMILDRENHAIRNAVKENGS
jgi:hypothetical protein